MRTRIFIESKTFRVAVPTAVYDALTKDASFMSAEFSRTRFLDRVWARLAEPQTAGLALLALGCAEALRHWQSSDEATMLTRVCAVVALCSGVISTLELLRPHPRNIASLAAHQFAHAWWFPFFDHEYKPTLTNKGWRWRASVGLYALCVLSIATAALISSVQYRPAGELMLLPGQEGQEAYREQYPENGLRRSLGLKLQLRQADLHEGTPYALVRATDMETLAATDITLRSSRALRVRDNVYALRELRPIEGIGGVTLRVTHPEGTENVTMFADGEAKLSDGSTLHWENVSTHRFGTLGGALQLRREQAGEILDRRWIYLDFPALNAQHAQNDFSYEIKEVKRPLAALISVQSIGGPAWGIIGLAFLALFVLLIALQHLLPAHRVGRTGDYLVLSKRGAHQSVHTPLHDENEQQWVTPVREEDLV